MPESNGKQPPEITLHLNGKHRTMSREELTQVLYAIKAFVEDQAEQATTLAIELHAATDPARLLAITATGFAHENERLAKLQGDCTDMLLLHVRAGLLTMDQVNAAIAPRRVLWEPRVRSWCRYWMPFLRGVV